jgi:hypothetical protein
MIATEPVTGSGRPGVLESRRLLAAALASALRDPQTARSRCAAPPQPGAIAEAWRTVVGAYRAAGGVKLDSAEADPAHASPAALEAWLTAPPESRARACRRTNAAEGSWSTPGPAPGFPSPDEAAEYYRAFGIWDESRRADDVPSMFGFLGHVLRRLKLLERIEHPTPEDEAHAEICREAISQFVRNHLGPRIPAFGLGVEDRARRAAAQEPDPDAAEHLRELAGLGRLVRAWVPIERALAATQGAAP